VGPCAHNSATMRTEQDKTKGSNRRGRRWERGWRRRPRRARAVAASFSLSSRRCRRMCLLLPLLILQGATTDKKQERRRKTGRQVEATRQVEEDKTGHRQDRTQHQPSRQTDSRSVISSPLPGAGLLYQGFGRLTGGKLLSEEDRRLAFVQVPVCRLSSRCLSVVEVPVCRQALVEVLFAQAVISIISTCSRCARSPDAVAPPTNLSVEAEPQRRAPSRTRQPLHRSAWYRHTAYGH
jgi:hypothetical protein